MRATLKALIYKALDLSADPVTNVEPPVTLHYYQGFHDVVSVFQLALGARLGEMYVIRRGRGARPFVIVGVVLLVASW